MNKLSEATVENEKVEITKNTEVLENVRNEEEKVEKEDKKEVESPLNSSSASPQPEKKKMSKSEEEKKEILKFTMLFNKFTSELDGKKGSRNGEEVKKMMFFNKEVTVNSNAEPPSEVTDPETKNTGENSERAPTGSRHKATQKNLHQTVEFGKPQISEPAMMFSSSLSPSDPEVFWKKNILVSFTKKPDSENLKKINKRNSKPERDSLIQSNIHRKDLRIHTSLTSLPRNNKTGLKGVLKSKIPSLTSIDTSLIDQKSYVTQFSYWNHLDDLVLRQTDLDKCVTLQICKSSNDNNKRTTRFKKEDVASVSDSKLLNSSNETKKHIKKCDKKSRGDSFRKERDPGSRKQVQWKTEVDVIYFSTNLPANGDRSGEVVGRVIEPLREEWEQQRKGFYAKLIPLQIEGHIKDRFKSLLKI